MQARTLARTLARTHACTHARTHEQVRKEELCVAAVSANSLSQHAMLSVLAEVHISIRALQLFIQTIQIANRI